ncbi:MAG: RNA pseudouridine synthase [Bacteriovoracaceae bacterium]|nr:RNA pseudouridine synthase [Bacteriovoracaceae bacterium]
MQNDFIDWCPLEDYSSGEQCLKNVFKISGQLIKKHAIPKKWLEKKIDSKQVLSLPLSLINRSEIYPLYHGPKVFILCEDQNILALHKPTGIHTHPHGYEESPNIVSWLCSQGLSALTLVNRENMDRGCLYRLDEGTSGLMLYAKNNETYLKVRADFGSFFKKKSYLCLVKGNPGSAESVEHFLSPFGPKGAQMKVSSSGQRARLSYRTLKCENNISLVQVDLDSGLRHQIRVQMSYLGFPLIGDTLYGGEKAARMFLHCYQYETMDKIYEDKNLDLFDSVFNLNGLL